MKFLGIIVLSIFVQSVLYAQSKSQYVVSFKNKANNTYSLNNPTDFLSEMALERRVSQGIEVDSTDLPISPSYLSQISSIPSVNILSSSKWFNDVVIETVDSSALSKIGDLIFVEKIVLLQRLGAKKGQRVKKELETDISSVSETEFKGEYGASYRQVSMLNADYLHLKGYRGEGMRISVIDAGFNWVWLSQHFESLFQENRIVDYYDFVDRDDSIYAHSIHGNYVLSTMASYSPYSMIGTAPKAEYILLRSEDDEGEYELEEYFWTEAAEFSDSAGSHIINSSLGYTTFDDSTQNHTWKELDGKTARITLSADMAALKGILVFNSAGNSGDKAWQKIGFPGDANQILTIGAVDSSENIAFFSSLGPTADGRIKPDLMAMGQEAIIGVIDGSAGKSNGTSFSSPILAGAAACLWQANINRSAQEIKAAMMASADRMNNPDTNYGNGIPDLLLADQLLKGNKQLNSQANVVYFPNPVLEELFILVKLPSRQNVEIDIFNTEGRLMHHSERILEGGSSDYIWLTSEVGSLSGGIYILHLKSENIDEEFKILKE